MSATILLRKKKKKYIRGLENIFPTKSSFSWHLFTNCSKQRQSTTCIFPAARLQQASSTRRRASIFKQHPALPRQKASPRPPQELYFLLFNRSPQRLREARRDLPGCASSQHGNNSQRRKKIKVFTRSEQQQGWPGDSALRLGQADAASPQGQDPAFPKIPL